MSTPARRNDGFDGVLLDLAEAMEPTIDALDNHEQLLVDGIDMTRRLYQRGIIPAYLRERVLVACEKSLAEVDAKCRQINTERYRLIALAEDARETAFFRATRPEDAA